MFSKIEKWNKDMASQPYQWLMLAGYFVGLILGTKIKAKK